MNIIFNGTDNKVSTHSNVGRETTIYQNSESTGKVRTENFALDISGTVMDNSAYAGHGRTAEEVMQEAGSQDITARRNYMAVMSNSMSDEDFANLQKDGFHPGSTDIETVVTIVDEIKAALLKGGTEVVGYTDTLSGEKLESITGSKTFANELQKEFRRNDIPLTEENVKAVTDAYKALSEIPELSEGSLKYMIENEMEPSADHLYLASFAGAKDPGRQAQGYYAAGTVSGYYAKKPETIDYEQLMPQIEKVIGEAGYPIEDSTILDAKWLVEKGITLTEDTFFRMEQLKGIAFPIGEREFAACAASAIADGITPGKADITKKESLIKQAVSIEEKVQELKEQDVTVIVARDLPFQLKNLFAVHEEQKKNDEIFSGKDLTVQEVDLIHKRELLEEVRLSMTVNANLKLLKSGYSIETAPMEELIEKLKAARRDGNSVLFQETEPEKAEEKGNLYQRTLYTLESIRTVPVQTVADITREDTLPVIEAKGKNLEAKYQQAGESYEALMTAPRRDMGDSIKKAFRNVDDILTDMGKELTAENQKVVRILGYNSMEMTEENFERIRKSEELLSGVIEKMKPGTVLSMIREDVNPLAMSLSDLSAYLDQNFDHTEQDMESYSRFLYKLEKKKNITEEERSAFIGIYRLLRQIEKGDDAAVGAVAGSGASETLENLLSAVRSSKKKHMDYRVDDNFGGIQAKKSDAQSVTEQIRKGFIKTREDLEEVLKDEETELADKEYDHTLYEGIRSAAGSEEAVLRHLMDYGKPVTADYLLAAGEMLKGSGKTVDKLKKVLEKQGGSEPGKADHDLSFSIENLTDSESAKEAYEEASDEWLSATAKEATEEDNNSLDVKALNALHKQISFMKSMAREENYVMPVEIGGELTAVTLRMIHKDGEESKVSVTLETEVLGVNLAEFTVTDTELSGYSSCGKEQGSRLLSENDDRLKELLASEDMEMGDIRFITGENQEQKEFLLRTEKGRKSGQTADTLYRAAKAYIVFVREISRKGSMEL